MDSAIHFSKYDSLNELDSKTQTFGCRCYNPDNCKHNGEKKCAFFNDERVCYFPPRGWDKTYNILVDKKNSNN